MTLASMTGFARIDGEHGSLRWTWELRSVNGKGLDCRLRLPGGFDSLEVDIRKAVGAALARGNVSINLSLQRDAGQTAPRLNEVVLDAVLDALATVRARSGAPAASAETILGIKGVFELQDVSDDDETVSAQRAALLASFKTALAGLVDMRRLEGEAVASVLRGHIERIDALTDAAETCPARQPEAIKKRLAQLVRQLVEKSGELDPDRLHQEAVLVATRADVREELDRLKAHVAAARKLLDGGGAVGRRLDFLAQEFNREANTLCSKSNDTALTAIGLDLKTTIDQMREQIQNLE